MRLSVHPVGQLRMARFSIPIVEKGHFIVSRMPDSAMDGMICVNPKNLAKRELVGFGLLS